MQTIGSVNWLILKSFGSQQFPQKYYIYEDIYQKLRTLISTAHKPNIITSFVWWIINICSFWDLYFSLLWIISPESKINDNIKNHEVSSRSSPSLVLWFTWLETLKICPFTELFFSLLVCKGAKADVVFLIDGSWSIGDDSFSKVVQFVFSVVGAFDVIGPSGMQVTWLSLVLGLKDVPVAQRWCWC